MAAVTVTGDLRTPRGLTDGDLTALPPSRSPRTWWQGAVDRLAGSDPGLQQLRTALQAVLGMALAVVGAWGFVRLTGAMEIDPAGLPPAVVAAQHHGALVIAVIMAAITAMLAGFVVNETSPRGQLVTSVLLPAPMLLALTIGLALGRWHVLALAWLVVALMTGVYLRAFGPRGFAAGMVLFNGSFLGYFLAASLTLGDLGWVTCELFIGVLASLVVRFGLLRRDAAATLRRMWQSWRVRARRLLAIASELTDATCTDRRRAALHERMRRQLVRLNESTLMIDAQLGDPESSRDALLLHQRLFDMELTLTNVCRFAVALSERCPDDSLRDPLRACLHALQDLDHVTAVSAVDALRDLHPADPTTAVLVDRFVQSVTALELARTEFLEVARRDLAAAGRGEAVPAFEPDPAAEAFTPVVGLMNGFLPGSGPVSDEAAKRRGSSRWFDSAQLSNPLRAAIQVGVAATIAVLVGGLLSDRRLYWALLATFLAFLATSNTGEQVRKALFRVGGTAIGIVVGDVIVHLVDGNLPVSFVVIGAALFLGIYLIRVNYAFMVIGITITMSLLYVQLGEFSFDLLVLRLEETAIGVGAVVLTVLVVVPLRPQRVLTAGVLLWFRALVTVVERSLTTVTGGERVTRLDVRGLDAAYQSLVVTATPLQRTTFGRNSTQLAEILTVAAAARYYARNLATGVQPWTDPATLAAWEDATAVLRTSLAVVDARLEQRETAPYVRSASLFDLVARTLPAGGSRERLVLRDLTLLDGALARLAAALRLPVDDLDTGHAHAAPSDPGRHRSAVPT